MEAYEHFSWNDATFIGVHVYSQENVPLPQK